MLQRQWRVVDGMSKRPDFSSWPQDETTATQIAPGQWMATRRLTVMRKPVELVGNVCPSEAAAIADVQHADEAIAMLLQAHADDTHRHHRGTAFDAMRDQRVARKLTGRTR
ncbi:MAG: hypothetical protein ACREUE_02245 [Panacagrimonas sp.]